MAIRQISKMLLIITSLLLVISLCSFIFIFSPQGTKSRAELLVMNKTNREIVFTPCGVSADRRVSVLKQYSSPTLGIPELNFKDIKLPANQSKQVFFSRAGVALVVVYIKAPPGLEKEVIVRLRPETAIPEINSIVIENIENLQPVKKILADYVNKSNYGRWKLAVRVLLLGLYVPVVWLLALLGMLFTKKPAEGAPAQRVFYGEKDSAYTITIFSKRKFSSAMGNLFALALFLFFEALLAGTFIKNGITYNNVGLLSFLILLVIPILIFFYGLLWRLSGKEIITLSSGVLSVTTSVLGIKSAKAYNLDEISNLRAERTYQKGLSSRTHKELEDPFDFWGKDIAFDFRGKSCYFGPRLLNSETKEIIAYLKERANFAVTAPLKKKMPAPERDFYDYCYNLNDEEKCNQYVIDVAKGKIDTPKKGEEDPRDKSDKICKTCPNFSSE